MLRPLLASLLLGSQLSSLAFAGDQLLDLAETPLFVSSGKNALVQLVVQRDNNLFFEAYPSYEDFNSDGILDIRYKPQEIDYLGYFGSDLCYELTTGDHLSATAAAVGKTCEDAWSGDFLNYLTMTRMDVMRRTLYGGKRSVDTTTETRLQRAFVPWENHTWGVEYESEAVDGFDISDYAPLDSPDSGTLHHFATNNFERNDTPYLRVRTNSTERIWTWTDKQAIQGDGWSSLDLPLEVKVCNPPHLEEFCRLYPDGGYKPVGLLHEYGNDESMLFSLLTGSFENNIRGGVLRQVMHAFGKNEVVENTGIFTAGNGIVSNLDVIQIPNDYINDTVQRDCGFLWDRPFNNGECRAWGNPVAEMMYEGMRYLAGENAPTSEFDTTGGMDETLGLSSPAWDDPYASEDVQAQCTNAYQLVISDPSPSYDGDQLPGSEFGSFTGSGLAGLHVGDLADFISTNDSSVAGLKFIGETENNADMAPSAKMVTSLRHIRGLSPEAPHRQGSYYASSVAYYGHQNDIHPTAEGEQTVRNFTLALGSQLPAIDVVVAGQTISFAPYAKTVGRVNSASTGYYPTNAIVGFNVEYKTDTTGSFRVSFEDNEQGADNDLDAVARYSYEVVGDEVIMNVDSIDAAGVAIQHMGFTVSGSDNDGIYLLVRDLATGAAQDIDFELDVPVGQSPGLGWNDGLPLPLNQVLRFRAGSNGGAQQLHSPLWYAAKWGGFKDMNDDGIPQSVEWDEDGDGDPDNYIPVVNPAKMDIALRDVLNKISAETAAGTSVGVTSGSLNSSSRVYQADFVSRQWTGNVTSRAVSADGQISSIIDWSANSKLSDKITAGTRQILTYNPNEGAGVPFRWPDDPSTLTAIDMSAAQINVLGINPKSELSDDLGAERVRYIRGEEITGFRERTEALGDIVHSSPQLVGEPAYYYPDNWGTGAPENNASYSSFARSKQGRQRVVYVGANDGMLHAFDAGTATNGVYNAGTGDELFAYVPAAVMKKLPELTHPRYRHKFFVDGTPRISDAFDGTQWRTVLVGGLRGGGQGIYALDVTNPGAINESTADDTVLWEFTDEDDADMGYSYSTPLITRMNNGKWVAIIANGYASTESDDAIGSGTSAIFILDLFTGQLLAKLTPNTFLGDHNGMSQPTAVDLNGDYNADIIYAGDLAGYIHAFDVSGVTSSTWESAAASTAPLFSAQDDDGNHRPVTSGISVGSHPTGSGVMLYFGTGKFLELGDQSLSTDENRLYGIWDKRETLSGFDLNSPMDNLLQQSITSETSVSLDTDDDGVDDTLVPIRQSSRHTIDWATDLGWYVDLFYQTVNGEQVLSSPVLRDGKLFLSTHAPSGNQCEPDEQGWLMVFNPANGAMPEQSPFDLNKDGVFDADPISGLRNGRNPFAEPTFSAAANDDVLLNLNSTDPTVSATKVDASINNGMLTWREIEP